ncbi:MAG: hypothetical protein JSS72_02625 [Armatimonadetes bacterium]|nr:hypothetical protein [Armatimonadota bacterium]
MKKKTPPVFTIAGIAILLTLVLAMNAPKNDLIRGNDTVTGHTTKVSSNDIDSAMHQTQNSGELHQAVPLKADDSSAQHPVLRKNLAFEPGQSVLQAPPSNIHPIGERAIQDAEPVRGWYTKESGIAQRNQQTTPGR